MIKIFEKHIRPTLEIKKNLVYIRKIYKGGTHTKLKSKRIVTESFCLSKLKLLQVKNSNT